MQKKGYACVIGAGIIGATAAYAWVTAIPPSGIPYIRQIGCENAWVNAGHGSLGLTLSVGSAMELAKKMDTYGYA